MSVLPSLPPLPPPHPCTRTQPCLVHPATRGQRGLAHHRHHAPHGSPHPYSYYHPMTVPLRPPCSGANFPLDLQTPPKAHAVRLLFQSVLLAMFWEMSQTTILDFKANMGIM